MKFANPLILYFLFLLIIPIIIHLFNFRKFKKVYFSNLAFLKNISQQSKKTSQIRHLIVLFTRLFFLFFLILAFAQPYFPSSENSINQGIEKRIAVYIDNSLSMQQKGKNGILMEEAKTIAREISSSYNQTDKYKLINNDLTSFEGEFVNRDDFMSDLRNLNFKPYSPYLSEIINKALNIQKINNKTPTDLFIISDFQKSIVDLQNIPLDSHCKIWLIPLNAQSPNNVYIDSIWIEDPVFMDKKAITLYYKIAKSNPDPLPEINVKLIVNGRQKGVNNINLSKDFIIESFQFLPDSSLNQNGYIQIDDFPVNFDDQYFFQFNIDRKFNVSLINPDPKIGFIERFFGQDSLVNFKSFNEKQLDINAISNSNLIIINSLTEYSTGLIAELEKHLIKGGNIIFIPENRSNSTIINQFNQKFSLPQVETIDTNKIFVTKIETKSKLFKDVFKEKDGELPINTNFPYFTFRYRLSKNNQINILPEIILADESPILVSTKYESGTLFEFLGSLNLDKSNFGKHALFIPTLYNTMIYKGIANKLYHYTQDEFITINDIENNEESVYHFQNIATGIEFIPVQRMVNGKTQLFLGDNINQAGIYRIRSKNNQQWAAFNYNATESKLNHYSKDELNQKIEELGNKKINVLQGNDIKLKSDFLDKNSNNELWKIFISFAILLLIIEVLLLRFLK